MKVKFCVVVLMSAVLFLGNLKAEDASEYEFETLSKPMIEHEARDLAKKEYKASGKEKKAVKKLSRNFDVSEETILDLRSKKYGYGEISHALIISEKSGESVEDIIALRESGMGWGEISKKYDLKPGKIKKEVKKTTKTLLTHLRHLSL